MCIRDRFTSHWWVFLAAALGTFIVVIDQSATSIVTPKIAVQFGIDIPASQWITIVYILTVSVLMIPAGAIADQIGRKRVWSIGLIIFALSSVLTLSSFPSNFCSILFKPTKPWRKAHTFMHFLSYSLLSFKVT